VGLENSREEKWEMQRNGCGVDLRLRGCDGVAPLIHVNLLEGSDNGKLKIGFSTRLEIIAPDSQVCFSDAGSKMLLSVASRTWSGIERVGSSRSVVQECITLHGKGGDSEIILPGEDPSQVMVVRGVIKSIEVGELVGFPPLTSRLLERVGQSDVLCRRLVGGRWFFVAWGEGMSCEFLEEEVSGSARR